MIVKNCKTCGTRLVVIKTIETDWGIKRIKHCTTCDTSLTSIEIHNGLYETLLRSHKKIGEMGMLEAVAPVSQDEATSKTDSEFQAGLDDMAAKLLSGK